MTYFGTEQLNYKIKSSNCLVIVFYFKKGYLKMTVIW